MGDVLHTPVAGQPIKQGWAMAYTDKMGNQQALPPQTYRLSTDPRGLYPNLPFGSGTLVDRFDDPTYYTA